MTNSASETDWFGDETGHFPDYQDSWRLDDLDDDDDFDDDLDEKDDDQHL